LKVNKPNNDIYLFAVASRLQYLLFMNTIYWYQRQFVCGPGFCERSG